MGNPGKGNRMDPEVNFPRNLALPGLQIKHSDIACHTTIEMCPSVHLISRFEPSFSPPNFSWELYFSFVDSILQFYWFRLSAVPARSPSSALVQQLNLVALPHAMVH
jgi:hypothetical protein